MGKWAAVMAGVVVAGMLCVPARGQPAEAGGQAGEGLVVGGLDQQGRVVLLPGRTAVLRTSRPYARVSIGQPEVADFNAIAPTSILVTGKKAGTTQLIVWDEQERSELIDVVVQVDLDALRGEYERVFPGARIEVTATNGNVMLRGRVPDLETAEQAVQVAAPFGATVLNFLEVGGGQQVMLQVRFAEVSRSAMAALGVSGAFVDGAFVGASNIGPQPALTQFTPGFVGDTPEPSGAVLSEQTISPQVTLFGAGQIGSFYLQAFVEALRDNNLMRVLAEPNLIAISGQEASFLAGGEFPVPVAQAGGTGAAAITVEFREFGVRLTFVPVVLGDGRIRLKLAPEVSEVDFSAGIRLGGFQVPGLRNRRVETTIELGDGQSFAIAGLLNTNVTASKAEVPVLGSLPVIGPLFRSVRYQRRETELVVLVTPRLVAPLNPEQVPALPGEWWRHPTESELFWKRDLGGPADPEPVGAGADGVVRPAPLFYGPYGFAPAARATSPAPEQEEPSGSE